MVQSVEKGQNERNKEQKYEQNKLPLGAWMPALVNVVCVVR